MKMSPQDLLKGYVQVSSLPLIHLRLEEAINDPRKSMSDIAKIIREDSGLTVRLLRVVNSAFYHFPSKIDTISQAVSIVGTQQISQLALATSVIQMFKGLPQDLVSMDSFWKHSIACGLAAKTLATQRRETNAERYFVAGMLHDIGRLIMFTRLIAPCREMLTAAGSNESLLYVIEQETLGFTHADVGGALLQAWKLPTSLEEAVTFHHSPRSASRFPVETAIVHLADIIVHSMELGSSGELFVPPLVPDAWDKLGLFSGALAEVVDQIDKQYHEALQIMLLDS